MKKIFIALSLLILLVSCTNNQSVKDESKIQTLTGLATLTWHGNETFNCVVKVTLTDDVIVKVEVKEGSYINTGIETFRLWEENKDEYLASYVGKTVAEINALEANDPIDVSNHYDGGSMSGCIDAIAGATASSTVVAKAVKDAVKNILSKAE